MSTSIDWIKHYYKLYCENSEINEFLMNQKYLIRSIVDHILLEHSLSEEDKEKKKIDDMNYIQSLIREELRSRKEKTVHAIMKEEKKQPTFGFDKWWKYPDFHPPSTQLVICYDDEGEFFIRDPAYHSFIGIKYWMLIPPLPKIEKPKDG